MSGFFVMRIFVGVTSTNSSACSRTRRKTRPGVETRSKTRAIFQSPKQLHGGSHSPFVHKAMPFAWNNLFAAQASGRSRRTMRRRRRTTITKHCKLLWRQRTENFLLSRLGASQRMCYRRQLPSRDTSYIGPSNSIR